LFLTQLIFGIGLIGIRNQVKFSMTGGVFRVITSAGLLIGEIFFVYFFMKIMLNPEFIFELLIKAMQDPDSLKAWIFLIKWSPRVIGLLGLMSMIFETVVLFFSVKKFG
jgi:hypothetical protein